MNRRSYKEVKETGYDNNELSTENEKNNLEFEKFIKVFVPIDENNKILKENIELVDSPGSGYKRKITEYIKEYAKDADIFVFVLMHDITEDDKKFFEFQTVNSTKPDIFVLINKWDDTDCDRSANIKESENHLLSKCDYLIMKMSENCAKTIRDRTYFISANEVFDIRINNNKEYLNNENKKRRYENFEKFESKIAEYIQSPKMHKYKRYSQELKSIRKELSKEFKTLCTNILNTLSSYSIKIINENIKKCKKHIRKIKKKCRKTKKNCIENIKCSVTKMMNTINIDNTNEINENIKKHYLSIEDDINKLYTDLDEKLEFIKDIYITTNNEDDENNDSDDNEESETDDETSTVSFLGEKNFQIQTDMQYITFPKSKMAVRFLSFIPIVGAIATNILMTKIDNADEHHLNKTSFNALEKEVHAKDEEKITAVRNNIENIKNHFIGEINNIIEKINNEKECATFLFEIFTKPDSIVNILFKDV